MDENSEIMMKRQLIILTAVLAFGTVNAQKIYKWTDENGNVHYSSTKPANDNVETIKLKPPKVRKKPKQADLKSAESKADEAKDKQEKQPSPKEERQANRQKAAVDAKEQQRECNMARKNLNALSSSTRVATTDENGARRMLTDQERVNAFEKANQAIKQNCQ